MPRSSLSCPSLGYSSGFRDEYVEDIFAQGQPSLLWGAASRFLTNAGEVLNRMRNTRRHTSSSPSMNKRQRNYAPTMPERNDSDGWAVLTYIAGQTAFIVQAVAVMSAFLAIHIVRATVLTVYKLAKGLVRLFEIMALSSKTMKSASTDLSASSSWWQDSSAGPQKIFRLGAWDDENEEEDSFEL